MKVREKIRGTFRSDRHATAVCDLRSVILKRPKAIAPFPLLRSTSQLGKRLREGRADLNDCPLEAIR